MKQNVQFVYYKKVQFVCKKVRFVCKKVQVQIYHQKKSTTPLKIVAEYLFVVVVVYTIITGQLQSSTGHTK